MSNKNINITSIGDTVSNQLYKYTADIQAGVISLVDKKADELKSAIQAAAPVGKRKGKYKKSFRVKKTGTGFSYYEKTVYSPSQYRLIHLLENGHVLRRGGRSTGTSPAKVHIQPAADKVANEFFSELKNIIQTSEKNGGGLR